MKSTACFGIETDKIGGGNKMRLFKNTILPMAALLILTYLGQYIFMVDGQIDWLRFCLVYGIPFGIPYMLWVIPVGGDPAGSVLILVFNILIGAVFGCLIAAFAAVKAVVYLIWWLLMKTKRKTL